jgi:hypothetical protein
VIFWHCYIVRAMVHIIEPKPQGQSFISRFLLMCVGSNISKALEAWICPPDTELSVLD